MTLRGFTSIQEELRHLKNVERPLIVTAIATAREFGDLSENAEYQAAKERQGIVEARIIDLEDKLSRAEIIDTASIKSKDIRFGATVNLVDCDNTESKHNFQIVGSDEADIGKGFLPITSPVAKALIGHKQGEIVEVNAPSGTKLYEIIEVKYI